MLVATLALQFIFPPLSIPINGLLILFKADPKSIIQGYICEKSNERKRYP